MKWLLAVGLCDLKPWVKFGTCIDLRFSAFCGSSSQVLSCLGGPLKGYSEEWILTWISLHSSIHWAPVWCVTCPCIAVTLTPHFPPSVPAWAKQQLKLKGKHPVPPAGAGGLRTDEDPRWEAVEEEVVDERNTRFLNLVIHFARITRSSYISTTADGIVFE